jgi:hypothetical protein
LGLYPPLSEAAYPVRHRPDSDLELMDPRVVLDETLLRADPGSRATLSVRILNPSAIVEGYTVEVLGDAAGWALVLPAEVSVFPGEEAVVEIAFDPPASAKVPAGSVPFGVRVRSRVDPDDSTVVEGDLEVGGFRNIDATMGPKTSHGRRSGKHHVDVTNWGNEEVTIEITASDPDENLSFVVKPPLLDVPIGSGRTAEVRVKGAAAFFRGPNQRHPFTVVARSADAAPDDATAWSRTLDGSFEQRAVLPRWVFVVVPLAAILVAAALWYMNRPEKLVSDSADAAAQPPAAPTGFTVAPAGPAAMTLTWEAVKDAATYNVLGVDPATKTAATPTILSTTSVPGQQNGTVVSSLVAGTEYCFEISAVNPAGESPPTTPPQCSTAIGASGSPAPGGVTVAYVNDDHSRAKVSWTDATGGKAEHVVLHDGVPLAAPIPAGVTSAAVDLAAGSNCFQVFSQLDDVASPLSEQACIDGPSDGSGTGSSTTGTTSADLGWIIVVYSTPIGDVGAAQRAEDRRAELQAAGFDAATLNSLQYDDVADGTDGSGFMMVYIGGFSSRDDAVAFCSDHSADFGTDCLPLEPGQQSA